MTLLRSLRAGRRSDLERIGGAAIKDADLEGLLDRGVLASVKTPAGPLLTLGPRAGQGKRRGPLAHALLAWGFYKTALHAAHLLDGFAVDAGARGDHVLVAWLQRQLGGHRLLDPVLDRLARRATQVERDARERRAPQQAPAYEIAWRGPAATPEAVRILFVEHPFRALLKQLALLPLDIHGLPPVELVLRPQDDGSVVDLHTGAPLWKGPRWARLERLFRPTARPTSFPFWETARLVTYRPELFYRAVDPKTWNRWSQR